MRIDDNTKNSLNNVLTNIDFSNFSQLPTALSQIVNVMQQNAEKVPEPVQKSLSAICENNDIDKK